MSVDAATRLEDAWSIGSYDVIGEKYLPMAARLVHAVDVGPGDGVVDVGCGTGNVAITAARRGADVTGVDVTPAMLERARENATRADLAGIDWREGDATALPHEDDAFDATLSSLGHMYADPPVDAGEELVRVTRPGGAVGFTAWTPTGLFPTMAGVLVAALPPDSRPNVTEPPFVWADEGVVADRLGDAVTDLSFETRTVHYPALSPAAFWAELGEHSGVFKTFLGDIDDSAGLRERMIDAIEPFFDATENAVELEYRLTTATVARTG